MGLGILEKQSRAEMGDIQMIGIFFPKVGVLLNDRYQILEVLDSEGDLVRYRAQEQVTRQDVLLIAFPFPSQLSHSALQRLENHLDHLVQLKHGSIPRFDGYFRQDVTNGKIIYLVQQEVVGVTLTQLMERGWKPSEKILQDIGRQLCTALAYLHNQNPPVAHQAIHPDHIIRQDNGRFILVNFGIVQAYYADAIRRPTPSTVTGYEAPESLQGQSLLASDLYSLGLVLLFLIIRQHPCDIPTHHRKIWVCQAENLSQSSRDWLERLIEPTIAHHFVNAEAALAGLPSPTPQHKSSDKAPFIPIVFQRKRSGWVIGLSPLWKSSGGLLLLCSIGPLVLLLFPAVGWFSRFIETRFILSQVNFTGIHCDQSGSQEQLKKEFQFQVAATASREEVALVLVEMGKNAISRDLTCAAGFFQEAIQLLPTLAVAYNNLGVMWYQKQEYPQAIAAFQEALRLNPGYGEANANLGMALEANGAGWEAIRVFTKVQPTNPLPTHRRFSLVLGVPSISPSGRTEILSSVEAIVQYRQALQRQPNAPDLHYNLAVALDSQGELDAAIAEYQTALQLQPEFAEAHGNLANSYALKGKRLEAHIHFQKARDLFRVQNRPDAIQKVEQLMKHFQLL